MGSVIPHKIHQYSDYGQSPTVKRGGYLFVCPVMQGLGENCGGKRDECDEHQVDRIEQKERMIGPNYMVKHCVMIDPDSSDDDKTCHIGEIRRLKG